MLTYSVVDFNKLRFEITSNKGLELMGRTNDIGRYTSKRNGGPSKFKSIPTTIEAVVGAAYLDGGMVAVETIVQNLGFNALEGAIPKASFKLRTESPYQPEPAPIRPPTKRWLSKIQMSAKRAAKRTAERGATTSRTFNTRTLEHANVAFFDEAAEPLDQHRVIVFRRLVRFYDNFLLLSALTGGLSVGALQFSEFHPSATATDKAAEGLLTSSACSAVLAVMLAVMLNFRFEGYASVTRLDYGVAWTPLVLLDWSIVAVLMGLLCWYWGRSEGWRAGVMVGTVGAVLCFCVWVAWWMWFHMRPKTGPGHQHWQLEHAEQKRQPGGVDDVV
ncbi:MAG: hypothetical protein Q9219_002410 [cf. Caloplaca sp. 3 TL-2023]